MSLGTNLAKYRKKSNLSQDEVALKLGVSRQTISNWELDETVPDIYQTKRLVTIFKITIDDLLANTLEEEIVEVINSIAKEKEEKVNWTKVWSQKYPILASYQKEVDISYYAVKLKGLIQSLMTSYGYNRLDAMLVLKDILGHSWNK